MITPQLKEKIKRIRLLILDVDSVLTDGRMVYDNKGNELKFFNVQDGFGIVILKRIGIDTVIMTASRSKLVLRRAKDINIKHVYQKSFDKLKTFKEIIERFNIPPAEICYMGDDLIDIPVLKRVGFAVSVPSAVDETKRVVHYITKKHGGHGAVREICDLIIKTQNKWDMITARYIR